MEKDIIDIKEPKAVLKDINEILDVLHNGFIALAMDYNYYVDSVIFQGNEGKERIYQLRDNVIYRFKAAKFHLVLIMRERQIIERRFTEILNKDPNALNHYDSGRFEREQNEMMSIYDSIIFHLSSAFDYLAMLINYNFSKKKGEPLKWIQLAKSCRDNTNKYSTMLFAKTIDDCDRNFISNFNAYRTELIHRQSSESFARVFWKHNDYKTKFKFIVSKKLQKKFKKIVNVDSKNTISFLTYKLLINSLLVTCEILIDVGKEFKENHTVAENIKRGAMAIGFFDPNSKTMKSISEGYWPGIIKGFNKLSKKHSE